jgi:hypothetical protein
MPGELFHERVLDANLIRVGGSPTYTRLEPQTLAGDPAEGLAAAVYDPLWLLGRQWQLGELAGEDAGTPLTVELLGTATPLRVFAPGDWTADEPAAWRPLPADVPLEELTEAEPPLSPTGLRAVAMAGSALCAALRDDGLIAAAEAVVARCPLAAPKTIDTAYAGVAALLASRVADAALVAAELEAAADLPEWLSAVVPPSSRARALALTQTWLQWYRRSVAPPAATEASWVGHRLEHRFRVSDGEVVLAAPEHGGDEVGWHTFDVLDQEPPQVDAIDRRTLRQRVVATPLRFPGMPASRFWEMEDAQVDLGAVGADPHQLARLLVVECALVYGGDWLVVPFDVPSGSIVRTTAVTYRTTFGETFLASVPAAATSPWRMYDVTSDAGVALGGLVVPPTAPGRLEGPAVEDVAFLRDELANLVWAVEHVVEGRSGDPVPVPPGRGLPTAAPEPVGEGDSESLRYVLATDVPDSWVPYLPHTAGYAAVDLVRGSIRRYGPDDPPEGTPGRPHGRLLKGTDLASIAAAEVPRGGVALTRVPVVARTADGTYRTWVARRVRVGRGEGRSNLAFDGAV